MLFNFSLTMAEDILEYEGHPRCLSSPHSSIQPPAYSCATLTCPALSKSFLLCLFAALCNSTILKQLRLTHKLSKTASVFQETTAGLPQTIGKTSIALWAAD